MYSFSVQLIKDNKLAGSHFPGITYPNSKTSLQINFLELQKF